MKTKTSFFYYAFGILVFLSLKWWHKSADNDDLYFLLQPVDYAIQLFTNSNSQYETTQGFYHALFNITIDKSCSGFNFWMIAFVVFYFLGVSSFQNWKIQALAIVPAIILSYLITLFANSARIFSLLIIEQRLQLVNKSLHQGVGAFIYLSFLIIFYLIFSYLLNRKQI